jgi:hypothetical protein
MLALIKTVHTVIFLFMSGCILYILYAGITQTYTPLLVVAVGSILVESAVYLGNRRRCPLTALARRYGDPTGHDWIMDIFLPKWAADLIFPVCGSLLVLAFLSLVVGWLLANRPA